MAITVSGLHTYPVKSMRGRAVDEAVVEPWGLAGDRRWMVIDHSGEALTARRVPKLLLLAPTLSEDGVWFAVPGQAPHFVPRPAATPVPVTIHGSKHQGDAPFTGDDAGDDAAAWLAAYVGEPVRLVHCDDPTRRRLNPAFARRTDAASFADAYPLLVTTDDSLRQLNDWIADGPRAGEGPLPMVRFRPNVVLTGAAPFAEDTWRRIRIGGAEFRAPKGCDRCVMTTTDPVSAQRGKEPIATMARHRAWDGATWFGMNLIPDNPGAVIRLGDTVEILEAEESDGPPR